MLFASAFGRVRVITPDATQALRFHRHSHEVALPLGEIAARYSMHGTLTHARLTSGELLYTPPYAIHAWEPAVPPVPVLVFSTAPEDDATIVEADDARLSSATDATRRSLTADAHFLLDKLELISVPATRRLGPFSEDVALYVLDGRGDLRADAAVPIAAGQLARVSAGPSVQLVAASTLRVLVFDPSHSTVSSILREGTKRYSQDDEELVIRDFFHDRTGGVFVDVGAGHYQRYSTTYYLEERLGWSGVAIDALAEYAEDYRRHRRRTRFVNALVTDRARGPARFYRADAFPELSSVSRPLAEAQTRELTDGGTVSERQVPTSTLDAILGGLGVRSIDLLSMDIEEHEPEALAGFDLRRFAPGLVCVEAHPAVRDALWSYFRARGYVRQDQYLAWDSANWYFAPSAQ
jgi:FkbM family methyltransferase